MPLCMHACVYIHVCVCMCVSGGIYNHRTNSVNKIFHHTLSVIRQVRNSLLSPTTITLLRKGISFLILFSMGNTWTFSPPKVVMNSRQSDREGRKERGSRGKEREAGRSSSNNTNGNHLVMEIWQYAHH